jgi:hypothetical protein
MHLPAPLYVHLTVADRFSTIVEEVLKGNPQLLKAAGKPPAEGLWNACRPN